MQTEERAFSTEQRVGRRTLLKQLSGASIASAIVVTAGCTGSAQEPKPALEITSATGRVTSFGNVIVTARVANKGDKDGSADLWVEVTIQNGNSYAAHRGIMVRAGETQTYEVPIDLPIAGSVGLAASGQNVSLDAWLENRSA
ncbi:hypothetical protein [Haloferax sp. DFSO52]|uniref:hypothetical protein n=1 Tax=Haloferax sp. DFSO52 TaxID=3388505 RepID=UPI003A88DE30